MAGSSALGAYNLKQVASSDFRYSAGRERLVSLRLGGLFDTPVVLLGANEEPLRDNDPPGTHEAGRRLARGLQLSCSINLDGMLTVMINITEVEVCKRAPR